MQDVGEKEGPSLIALPKSLVKPWERPRGERANIVHTMSIVWRIAMSVVTRIATTLNKMPRNTSILYKRDRRSEDEPSYTGVLKLSPEMARAAVENGLWVHLWRRTLPPDVVGFGSQKRVVPKPAAVELQVHVRSSERAHLDEPEEEEEEQEYEQE
jgi:hypothetical protein